MIQPIHPADPAPAAAIDPSAPGPADASALDLADAAPDAPLPLLEDGSLVLSAAPGAMEVARAWLPRLPGPTSTGEPRAEIRVDAGAPDFAVPAAAPGMELYGVRGWNAGGGAVVLADRAGRIGARVELEARRARVRVDTAAGPQDPRDVFATFTIAAGLLLTRLERALVHAAAVVAPDGGAWLLPGSSFSGKSTTAITLIRGGWNYLCDDHVVVGAGPDGALRAEGWPRAFQLDRGYAAGASEGVRARVEPHEFGPGRWQRAAPLAGILFPRVEAELPTGVTPLHPAAAFALVMRQSPFVGADRGAAGRVLALLERVAHLPAWELRLGRDTYCNAQTLQLVLSPILKPRT